MTSLSLTDTKPQSAEADVLVVGSVTSAEGAALAPGHGLPAAAARHVEAALATVGAKGKAGEVILLPAVPKLAAAAVAISGLGVPADAVTHREVRGAAAAAVRATREGASVALALGGSDELRAASAEGALAGDYAYAAATAPAERPARALSVLGAGQPAEAAIARAAVLGAAQEFARDLVNTPPNLLYPETFAQVVRQRATSSKAKVSVEVMDEKALADAGCGGIIGVGQGSSRPPRIVMLSYKPGRRHRGAPTIALVGKGITFDSGGLCIKPSASMLTMKCDMAGAAATAAAVFAAAELALPVAVTAYLCLAENMPGATAQRPGDVVTMRGGTTVEIIDTDAEGRMVLGDGLALASEAGPDAIIDVATLTGACVVALGPDISGVMANNEAFGQRVLDAAEGAGEHAWPLPLPDELKKQLESTVADLSHKGERWGGALTAGLFLENFVGTLADGSPIPWAHIDIAGPAFNEGGARGVNPKGGTGYGVATLLGVLESFAG
ncbi:leucyl aminopeptidase [Actinomycetota bacterium]